MVYKEPEKAIWVRLGPISVSVRFAFLPTKMFGRKKPTRVTGSGLICFPTTPPRQDGIHELPPRHVCFLSSPEDTCWSRAYRCDASCVVFGTLAEFAKTLTRGTHIHVEGELRSREYDSKKTDAKQRVWEIRITSILKLDRAEKATAEDQEPDEASQGDAAA